MGDRTDADEIAWLLISYNLPTEPSRYRVATWRSLKRLGALNIQQSLWCLPLTGENDSSLRKVSADIEEAGGSSFLMKAAFVRPLEERRVVGLFDEMRDVEYGEFVAECEKFLAEIRKEISKAKFIFAELEEEEAEFEKLAAWYGRIAARDLFGAAGGAKAKEKLEKIRGAIEGYGELVYVHESKDATHE